MIDADVQPLEREEVGERLSQVAALLDQRQNVAAMLLAWSAAEAALRLIAKENHVRLREPSPAYIVKELFAIGLLDRDQYDMLQEGVRDRNTLVHGYKNGDVDREGIRRLVESTQALLETKVAAD